MSNSPLISYVKLSPNFSQGRGGNKIDTITIHCMAGNLSVEGCGEVFAPSSRQASSNYGVGTDGRVALYVDESNRSWCTSSGANDRRAVTIEVANDGGEPDWHVSDRALDSLVKLCADICRRNGIKKLLWKGDKGLIGNVGQQNMTVHRWFASKSCPGDYLYGKHSYIAQKVNYRLANPSKDDYNVPGDKIDPNVPAYVPTDPDDPNSPVSPTSPGSYVDPKSLVDVSQIHPYIATIGPEVIKFNCDKMKEEDVVGIMVYGGAYYTLMHTKRELYRASNIKKQIEIADKADMPYAMYVSVRARTVEEAKLECNQLWYLVSKYPPKLGLWLKLETAKPKAITDKIIEVYYTYIEKWGMKDLCGIYTDRDGLKEFTWDNFYERFSLWLVDHVSSMSGVDDELLTPEFFMLGE